MSYLLWGRRSEACLLTNCLITYYKTDLCNVLQESTKGDKHNQQGHAVKEGLIMQPADDRVRYENGHRVHVGNGGGENNQEVHPN